MSGDGDPKPTGEDAEAAQPGILGNLPRTRPSVRSPRRDATPKAGAANTPDPSDAGRSDDPVAAATGERPPANEIEQLAKAGLTLAGGVASIGLKVAGRAASTLRETIERR